MFQKLTSIFLAAAILSFPGYAHALRCGSDLVNVGDLKINVQLACGEPFSRETIGYIDQVRYTAQEDNSDLKNSASKEIIERIRVMSVEEWIIKDNNNYYSLVFEGNTLKSITWAVRD